MIFVFRAIFWMAIVAAFVPANFTAAKDGVFAKEAHAWFNGPGHDGLASVLSEKQSFCSQHQQACDVLDQFGRYAGFVADIATEQAEQVVANRLSQTDSSPSIEMLLIEIEKPNQGLD